MKLATIGIIVVSAAAVSGVSPVKAHGKQSGGVAVVSIGSLRDSRSALGAPLYAGPNVIIVGGGNYYGRPRGYRRHHYLPRTRYGYGYNYGYQWRLPRYAYPRYGYQNPYPRHGAFVPRPARRYKDSYRSYGRERYESEPRLTILGATYRSIDGQACDAYSFVHRRCDGKNSCSVRSSNKICGDPDRGRLKILEVVYACGEEQSQKNVPERSRLRLRCWY